MVVNIDIERSSFYNALLSQEFGHTYVKLMDSQGRAYTYGFYPANVRPNETRPAVPGCVHHPDTTHSECTDEQVMYTLSQTQHDNALSRAQELCRASPTYHAADYNCTTFAGEIVGAAGQSLPFMRGRETVFYQTIEADNPNTLLDHVREERRRAPSTRFPFWNNPCFNRCEGGFEKCINNSRASGMECYGPRAVCLRNCPPPA
jgi:hypothetical protein